jgi:hypothetical protein
MVRPVPDDRPKRHVSECRHALLEKQASVMLGLFLWEEGKELSDFFLRGSPAILADFEGLGILDGLGLFGAVPRCEFIAVLVGNTGGERYLLFSRQSRPHSPC